MKINSKKSFMAYSQWTLFHGRLWDYTPRYRNKALYRFRKKNNRHQPYFTSDDLVLIALYRKQYHKMLQEAKAMSDQCSFSNNEALRMRHIYLMCLAIAAMISFSSRGFEMCSSIPALIHSLLSSS